MSVGVKIIKGNKVPVELQVTDGSSILFPRAVVFDKNNVAIASMDLTHISNGLYRPLTDYIMPAENRISVQYLVFKDSLRTVTAEYDNDIDLFILDIVDKILATLRTVEVEMEIDEASEIGIEVIGAENGELEFFVESNDQDDILITVDDGGEVTIDITVEDAGNIEIDTTV